MRNKILSYLANGLSASQVATLVGCSPSYISQLLSQEDFKAELKALILDNPTPVDEKLEDKYSAVEHALVNAVQDAIPGAELPAISRALETVARIRHDRYLRKNPTLLGNTNNVNVNVVQLTLPSYAVKPPPAIVLNEKSEIISIDSKPMAPLSSEGVKNLFAGIAAKKILKEAPIEATAQASTYDKINYGADKTYTIPVGATI